jgi:hypothetical protein
MAYLQKKGLFLNLKRHYIMTNTNTNTTAKLSKVSIALKNAPELKTINARIHTIGQTAQALDNEIWAVCIEILKRFELSVKFKEDATLTDKEKSSLGGLGDITPLNNLLAVMSMNFLDYNRVIQWFKLQTKGAIVADKSNAGTVKKSKDYIIEDLTPEYVDAMPHPMRDKEAVILSPDDAKKAQVKKLNAQLDFDKRFGRLREQAEKLAMEYNNFLSLRVDDESAPLPKLDVALLAKVSEFANVKMLPT